MIPLTTQEFRQLARFIHEQSGIYLDDSKAYLVENRLAPLLEEEHFVSFSELYARLQRGTDRSLLGRLIDLISTNETSFFRDRHPFELLRFKLLPDLFDRLELQAERSKSIAIWSAACATGQEIYSLAMVLQELLGPALHGYRVRIVGSDISDKAIVQASRGRYSQFEVNRGLDQRLLHKYFTRNDTFWQVRDELRSMVYFTRLNLLEPAERLGHFDIILCRNVAIYFTMADRQKLFRRLAGHLSPDGCLLVGATESLQQIDSRFQRLCHHNTYYYKLSPAPEGGRQGIHRFPRPERKY